MLFCFTTFFFFFGASPSVCLPACVRVRARACAPARCGLRLICCLRNTITFLLSDRVSRRTRDRARQCALETGDGARAPEPSSSFTDGAPSAPLLRSVVGSLPSTATRREKLRVGYELGLFYSGRRGCQASVERTIEPRVSGSLGFFSPPLSPFCERFGAGFAP